MLDFPPSWNLRHVPASSFALKFVHVSANKIKTPINKGKWLLDLTRDDDDAIKAFLLSREYDIV